MTSTQISHLSDRDFQILSAHWSMFTGYSFCHKFGRKWVAKGFGIDGPSFATKKAAERYVSNLVCDEGVHPRSAPPVSLIAFAAHR